MGTELYYAADALESDALTHDALAMAERVGDVAVIAYTATTRHFACQRPEIDPKTRIDLADRAIALTQASPASDVLAFALQERMMDLLELGDGEAFDLTFARFEETTTALGQPFFTWLLSLFRGTRLLLEGKVDEAERMAIATLEIGQRLGTPNAEGAFAGQLFFVRREQGRLGELAAAFDDVAQTHRALPIFRAGRAAIASDASQGEANRALEEVMADDLDDFPRDQNWIATLGVLAPAALAAQSEHRIRQLLSLLAPYSGRMIVVGQGAALHGAVDHHMGLLHAALGEAEQAALALDAARALHTRAHAPLWLEHTRRARAGV
jgi:hypothetical protein